MCLIVVAWKMHPEYSLLVAANRDEFHARPAQPAGWWSDRRSILAGRDLQAGGTWLGVSRNGRFAAVTNYRERKRTDPSLRSRGELVPEFLDGSMTPIEYAGNIDPSAYSGFNLLCADGVELCCLSNRGTTVSRLSPGFYGLSNAALDTPWPKLLNLKNLLQGLVDDNKLSTSEFLRLLDDRRPAPAADIHSDELPFTLARSLSAPFIVTADYGTRCSSAVLVRMDGQVDFAERSFDNNGDAVGNMQFKFSSVRTDT